MRNASEGCDLAYTIVRPGKLTDEESTGSVQLAERTDRAAIPRDDVAEVLAALIDSGSGTNVTFEVVSGSTPIADAVSALG